MEGARRVGKSTIVEEFARNEYRSYILIDSSLVDKNVIDLFDDLTNLDYLLLGLQTIFRVDLYERESLIIFDKKEALVSGSSSYQKKCSRDWEYQQLRRRRV